MATGTRQMKEMGGLAQRMPVTRATCTVASASIVGIPPFNGFWSKLFLVVAAIQASFYWVAALIVFVSLCTLIMYLKVQRYVFLGELPKERQQTQENRGSMLVAMVFLACLCMIIGFGFLLLPGLRSAILGILDPAVEVLKGGVAYADNVIQMAKQVR
jgi:multicomponent Na+:H+ antiporter subunit D